MSSAESCVLDLLVMAHSRQFRFAVELHGPLADRTWNDTVREVEDLGYSTMFVPASSFELTLPMK